MQVRSGDIDIHYEVRGKGAPVVMLHPFPTTHAFWLPAIESLESSYRFILPDLRGHGQSGVGSGPALISQHADDVVRLCNECGIGKAVFIGCSIGGYVLFELWRKVRERMSALVLCNTKADADTDDARKSRMQSAQDVLERGPEWFIDSMIPKLIGESTQRNRPDVVSAARRMMMQNTAQGISAVQKGMAERVDSTETLGTITAPTLVIGGDEDQGTPLVHAEKMHRGIRNSELRVIAKAGHYAAFEQPMEVGRVLREFLEKVKHG